MTRIAWIGTALFGAATASGLALFHAARTMPAPDLPALPGVTLVRMTTEEGPRLVVTSLRSNGAAAHAGLQVGDRVEAADGQPADSLDALRRDLDRDPSGAIDLRVRRGTTMLDVNFHRPNRGGHIG